MYQYQYSTFASPPQTQTQISSKQDPYLLTSPNTHLAVPNLSPGSFSSGVSSDSDFGHGQQHHHQDSLSEDDGCPTPVLSPSIRQSKHTSSDETLDPRGYDTGPHEPIHLPVQLSPMQPQSYLSPSNKRKQRMAKLRSRLWHNRPPTMEYGSVPLLRPFPMAGPPPRYLWCLRSHDVGRTRDPWRAFIPANQALLWQFPGHDIHIRDPAIAGGSKVITVAADRGIAYYNDPNLRAPETFEIQLIDMAQRPVVWEPINMS
ncbi:hypothetical protein INT43_003294 [Umbelopsis isabellina]|uniref:Uncharacterized protein n=1 Tax=Mortierella isabellina TaxID=91625 RepID=A0A8H7UA70_MORIS|nr:hypothetical protein INT43_003294 [Umbelopsis isabellina]